MCVCVPLSMCLFFNILCILKPSFLLPRLSLFPLSFFLSIPSPSPFVLSLSYPHYISHDHNHARPCSLVQPSSSSIFVLPRRVLSLPITAFSVRSLLSSPNSLPWILPPLLSPPHSFMTTTMPSLSHTWFVMISYLLVFGGFGYD